MSQLEGLDALLLDVPRLVGLFEDREWGFVDDVKAWLGRVEMVLQSARSSAVSEVAACRAEILAAEAGTPIASITLPPRTTRRKVRDAVALSSLTQGQELVREATASSREAVDQSRRVLRGLLATAGNRGLFDGDVRPPFETPVLTRLWSRMVADEIIGPSATQVLALMGFGDTIVLLRRILAEWAEEQRSLVGDGETNGDDPSASPGGTWSGGAGFGGGG